MAADNRSGQVIGVAVTFLILTWLTVCLRCYVRIFIVKGFGLDDKVMVLTLCLFTSYLVCQIGGAAHGTGIQRHLLTDENAQIALRFWYFCEIFYTTSTSVLKIAVGLFFLRITTSPLHIWIIRIIMIVSGIVGVGYTGLVIFQCNPISYWWDLRPDATGKCLSSAMVTNFTYAVSALNSFADWTFGILPIFIVKDLQMKKRVKVVVASIIALAAIGSTATIIRLPYTGTLNGYKGNFLYRTVDFAIWTTVEVGIGITAGCIATLRPLTKTRWGSFGFGSTRPSFGAPWSKGMHSRSKSRNGVGQWSNNPAAGAQPLDDMQPGIATKQVTTTTITGGRGESDEETFLDTDSDKSGRKGWKHGISKNITTTVVEERAASRLADRRRSASLDDGERGKPARVHDSF